MTLLPLLSPEIRIILWLVTGLCSLVMGILLAFTSGTILYWLRRTRPVNERTRDHPPPALPRAAWATLGLATLAALGAAVGIVALPGPVILAPKPGPWIPLLPLCIFLSATAGAAGWVGFGFQQQGNTSSARPPLPGGLSSRRFPAGKRLISYGVLALAVTLLGMMGINAYLQRQNLQDKVVVLITNLDGPRAQGYRLTESLLAELRQDTQGFDGALVMAQDVAIIKQHGSENALAPARAAARALGKGALADLVIWGYPTSEAGSARLTVHIENLAGDPGASAELIQRQAALADVQSFGLQQSLAGQVKALAAFISGLTSYTAEDYRSAVAHLEQALSHPDWAEEKTSLQIGYFYQGNALFFLGQYERAVEAYTAALEINQQAEVYFNRGLAYHQLEHYEQAISNYGAALQIDPQDVKAYQNRGLAYHKLEQYERAIADYDAALQINPKDAETWYNRALAYAMLEQYERAIAGYTAALKVDPQSAKAFARRGNAHYKLEQYEQAIADYDAALAIDPEDAKALSGRGAVYYKLEQYERAIADYDAALAIDPQFARAYYNRGNAYLVLEHVDQAIADYNAALEIDPEDAAVLTSRGNAFHKLEQYERAIADYSAALEVDSRYAAAFFNRGLAYTKLGQYEQAIADYNAALEINPQDANAYYKRGNAYLKLEQYERAIADYNAALENDGQYAAAFTGRGNAYFKLEQYGRAIADFGTALELDPQHAAAYTNRGNAYYKLEQYQPAIADFNAALEINPMDAAALYNRGLAYAKMGQYDRAGADYQASLQLCTDPAVCGAAEAALAHLPVP